MTRIHAILALLFLAISASSCTENRAAADRSNDRFDSTRSDRDAIELVNREMAAVGAAKFATRVKYLQFRFVLRAGDSTRISRLHRWNLEKGDYQIEWQEGDSVRQLVLFNLHTPSIFAARNQQPIVDTNALQAYFLRAYAVFINDTYWLLAPLKLKDPGVILKKTQPQSGEGEKLQTLSVSFDRVGLTPENQYTLYLDPQTHLLVRWDYFERAGAQPRSALWGDWRDFGGVKLALSRQFIGQNLKISFEDVEISESVDSSKFTGLPAAEQRTSQK